MSYDEGVRLYGPRPTDPDKLRIWKTVMFPYIYGMGKERLNQLLQEVTMPRKRTVKTVRQSQSAFTSAVVQMQHALVDFKEQVQSLRKDVQELTQQRSNPVQNFVNATPNNPIDILHGALQQQASPSAAQAAPGVTRIDSNKEHERISKAYHLLAEKRVEHKKAAEDFAVTHPSWPDWEEKLDELNGATHRLIEAQASFLHTCEFV